MIEKFFFETRKDGVDLYQRKSTLKVKLRQVETGQVYDDPIDVEPCPYTYEETDIPIDLIDPEPHPDELTLPDALDMLSEFGVNTEDGETDDQ